MTLISIAPLSLLERAEHAAGIAGQFAADVDVTARFPAEAVAALRESGLLAASVPRRFGGEGASLTELAQVAELLGAACSSTGMVFAMHHSQVLSLSRHLAGAPAIERVVSRIAADGLLVASATTELGVGGDVRSSLCFVDASGGATTLVKNTPVISYGSEADLILVTARRDADSAPGDQVLVVCDRADTALERTGTWDTMGLRGTSSFGYLLTATVAAERVVPVAYETISTETMLPAAHVLWAAVWLGMARSATDISRRYVRATARRSIGTIPAGATALVGLVAELERFESLVASSAHRFDEIADDRDALGSVGFVVSMNNLKVTASTLVADMVARALNITGISGFRNDGPYSVSRLFRDAQGAALMVHNDRITANTAHRILIQKGS
ncbi:acyl-CoA dehydrogenase family protein [Salinibacterium sp. G-O1]|uniref:acyl-CoA dehydrogenase family protein n=1 Tax=Salinibacterium sp. G-O1 TaxID=3046208 RepID=UPI0024B98446|nr:acyl-CoA dehydrogenase family protein [Salinibacterium sp. G-O1]MDJ0333780.1 acyl-CoA dehydrogenase family protein [Salinibacterium sp. G-O1]